MCRSWIGVWRDHRRTLRRPAVWPRTPIAGTALPVHCRPLTEANPRSICPAPWHTTDRSRRSCARPDPSCRRPPTCDPTHRPTPRRRGRIELRQVSLIWLLIWVADATWRRTTPPRRMRHPTPRSRTGRRRATRPWPPGPSAVPSCRQTSRWLRSRRGSEPRFESAARASRWA